MVLTYGDTAVVGGGVEGAPGQHILLVVLKYVDTVVAGGGVPGQHILPGVLTYVDTAVAGGGVEGASGQHILPGVHPLLLLHQTKSRFIDILHFCAQS